MIRALSQHRPSASAGVAATALMSLLALTACSSGGSSPSATQTGPTGPATPTASTPSATTAPVTTGQNYHPSIVPSQFSTTVDNRYFPLKSGTSHLYKGTRDGVPTSTRYAVLKQTKTVMGVKCLVISDIVTQNHSLVEKTTDWYAQDREGNVWYFGENTAEYANGIVTNTDGTWEAGVDHALPGIVMKASSTHADHYRQEYRPGIAEDTATVLQTNASITLPLGSYQHVMITRDINPLDPTKHERKWFAPGVGFVHADLHQGGHHEVSSLVK
ncbi:MAG: hypothetical protein JWR85_286 [Marmoricola sp.]|nr:hypothetical protein [Marmoricola sp.]